MSHYLGAHQLGFFRVDPLPHVRNILKPKKHVPYSGVADYLTLLKDPKSKFHRELEKPVKNELLETEKDRAQLEKEEAYRAERKAAAERDGYNPKAEDANKTKDAYVTMFVGRLAYDVTERELKKELERYASIKSLKIVYKRAGEDAEPEEGSKKKEKNQKSSKSKEGEEPPAASEDNKTAANVEEKNVGYAFVEFNSEDGFLRAFKRADGMRIAGRRVVLDVERARTVDGWLPAKYGGGIGKTRDGKRAKFHTYSGRFRETAEEDYYRRERRKAREAAEQAARGLRDSGGRGRGRGGRGGRGRGGGFDRGGDRRRGGDDRRDRGDRRGGGGRGDRDRRRDSRDGGRGDRDRGSGGRSLMDRGNDRDRRSGGRSSSNSFAAAKRPAPSHDRSDDRAEPRSAKRQARGSRD